MVGSDIVIDLAVYDYQERKATLHRSDGMEAVLPVELPDGFPANLRSVSWAPRAAMILVELLSGDTVLTEMARFDCADQLADRVVVYLDQNKWRTMADAVHAPSNVHDQRDLIAALRLTDLVEERRVVLPLSSGHGAETTKWGNTARRQQVALRALQLARGWQMTDPLVVRLQEIHEEFRGSFDTDVSARQLSVFTLQPNATSRESRSYQPSMDMDVEAAHALQAISFTSATIDTWLDASQIPPISELPWVRFQQGLSNWLDRQTTWTGGQKRKVVDASLLNDLRQDLTQEASEAKLTQQQLAVWLKRTAHSGLSRMPALGAFRGLLHERHLNTGTTWTANDLTDMVYLSCATGYANVVVAERHMTATMRQALNRLQRPITIFPTLHEALPTVEALLT